MSDLRDRIAAALYRQFPPYQLGYSFGCPTERWEDESEQCKDVYRRDADAVITELGLRQEWQPNSCVGPQETLDDALLYSGGKIETRWVTDWTKTSG